MAGTSRIDVVEAAYALDGGEQAWLAGLARAARPALDRGLGVVAYLGETKTLRPIAVAAEGISNGFAQLLQAVSESTMGGANDAFVRQPMRFVAASESFFGDDALRAQWDAAGKTFGIVDGVGVYVHAGAGRTVHLFAPSPHQVRPHAREKQAWLRVAVHLAAGHRIRTQLAASDERHFDALLDSKGRVHDARGDATSASARVALREAVQAMETARGRMRRNDSERALELWRGLVGGRWSLIDRWDTGGKRFIAAVENRPGNLDPRALRPREGSAARLAAEGAAPKDIAYALGISPSNARAILASALGKLGLSSRAELFRWRPEEAHVLPGTAGVENVRVETLVLSERAAETVGAAQLTQAELVVARLAAKGTTNAEIARIRGTSVRTIANQMAAILRKLGVSSRADILRAAKVR